MKSYAFLIRTLKAPFSVASSYGVLPAISPCQLAGLERALLSVALAMLTKMDTCGMDNVVKQSRYLITSLRYVTKATSRAALTRRKIIVPLSSVIMRERSQQHETLFRFTGYDIIKTMNKLEELRNNIDQVDQEIVQLLEKRMTIVQEISQEKQAQKITILDNSREQAVLDLARQNIKNSAYQETIINTFKDIMKNSRLYQRENREQ